MSDISTSLGGRIILCVSSPYTDGEDRYAGLEIDIDFIPRIGETIEITDEYRATWGDAGQYEDLAPFECLVDKVVYNIDIREAAEPGDPPIKDTSVWVGTSGAKRMEP